jgi:hypothetical protein
MDRKNQIIKTNKKEVYQIENTKKYIPKVLSVRNCQNCKKIIEYIPRRTKCINCYNNNNPCKFIDEEDEIFNIYND